eukprot:709311-Pelagomonas_calceolata.AAC.1
MGRCIRKLDVPAMCCLPLLNVLCPCFVGCRAVVYDSVDSKARPFLLRRLSNGTNGGTQGMPGAPGSWAAGEESEVGPEPRD